MRNLGAMALILFAASGLFAAEYDVVVYGGTCGGIAAAIEAGRSGKSVVLIEPSRHLGGMTTGGLGATDIGFKPSVGGISREFYRRILKYYQSPEVWKHQTAAEYNELAWKDAFDDALWYFEPGAAMEVYRQMLEEAKVSLVINQRLNLKTGVKKQGARIISITMESGENYAGKIFIDGTYEGDLMAKSRCSYHIGREANPVYNETVNGIQIWHGRYSGHLFARAVDPFVKPGDPASGLIFGVQNSAPGKNGEGDARVQAYCFRVTMTDAPGNRVPFPKPEDYDPARYQILLRHLTSTKKFPEAKKEEVEHPVLGFRPLVKMLPNRKKDGNSKGAVSFNLVGFNYDYPDGDYATREKIVKLHENWQKGLIWFVANDPRVPAQYREPMKEWGLPKDEYVDNGHWPPQLYVREARRMIGQYVMTEHDCSRARLAPDSIGMGSYTMDSHVTRYFVDEERNVRAEGSIGLGVKKPYPISYQSITPKQEQCENLLVPVALSASHVAYGSIRMEPVFMILGQSAGAAASLAIDSAVTVQKLDYEKLKTKLLAEGQVLQSDLSKK